LSMENLAVSLANDKKLDEAEALHRQALAIRERYLPSEQAAVALDQRSLAEVLWQKQNYPEAEELYSRSIENFQKLFGPDDLRTRSTIEDPALLLTQKKDVAAAERLRRQLLAQEETHSRGAIPLTDAIEHLANLLSLKNDSAECISLLRRSLSIKDKEFGPTHPSLAKTLANLGWHLWKTKELKEAEVHTRRALALGEHGGVEAIEFVIVTLHNLGMILQEQGDFANAEPLVWRALTLAEKLHKDDEVSCIPYLDTLAALRRSQGDAKGAESLLRQVLSMKEKGLKPNNPALAMTLSNLAVTLQDQGNNEEAEKLLRHALGIYDSVGGNDVAIGSTLYNLATLLFFKGRYGESEPFFRRALSIREKIREADHVEIGQMLSMLAKVLECTGDLTGAGILLGRAYNIFVKSLGETHPTTSDVKARLNALMMTLAPIHAQ